MREVSGTRQPQQPTASVTSNCSSLCITQLLPLGRLARLGLGLGLAPSLRRPRLAAKWMRLLPVAVAKRDTATSSPRRKSPSTDVPHRLAYLLPRVILHVRGGISLFLSVTTFGWSHLSKKQQPRPLLMFVCLFHCLTSS